MGAGLAAFSWALCGVYCALTDRWIAVAASAVGALGYLPAVPTTDKARPRVVAIFSAANIAAIVGLASQTGGVASPALVVLVPVVLSTALLMGERFAVVSAALALLGGLGLFAAEQLGLDVGSSTPLESAVTYPIALTLAVVLGAFAHRAVQAERAMALTRASEAQAHARELAEARDALEKNALQKSAFYATMSHEVRTPLGGLLGLLTALEGSRLDPEQRQIVGWMKTSGEALRLVADDMLDLESIERGALRLKSDVVDPLALLSDVAVLYRSLAGERGVQLDVDVPAGVPRAVAGDPLRLRQIVQNLVANAVKFTDRGTITLRARHMAGMLELSVIDTGRGIPEDRLAAIFLPFEQADPTLARRFGGSGLGLSIVRHLARAMGGDVTVESVLGAGTTFVVTLPAIEVRTERAARSAPPPPVAPGRHAGLRALIVDDDRIHRVATALVLRRLGVSSVEVDSHARARALAEDGDFDLVLLDQHMPDGLGSALAKTLPRAEGRPLVALVTASALSEDRAAAQEGNLPFLHKPVQIADLSRLLDQASAGRGLPPARPSATVLDPETAKELDAARLDELLELSDRAELSGLLDAFLEQLDQTTVELKGEIAGDAVQIRKVAHRLRGSAANMGAHALEAAARQVENGLDKQASSEVAAQHARALEQATRRARAAVQRYRREPAPESINPPTD